MKSISLYLHIPFCRFACHYCDFAKTANYSSTLVDTYFAALQSELKNWTSYLNALGPWQIPSVFIGGGTPSLFSAHYAPILEFIRPYLEADAEVSLEANPQDITQSRLKHWKALGINRLSIGVQTFVDIGLKELTRQHSGTSASQALELASKYFGNYNVDLIFGWSGQTASLWQNDLDQLALRGVPHVSLYSLSYEGNTPFGRSLRRSARQAMAEDLEADLYAQACAYLGQNSYRHQEVSNWAKPENPCRHNWRYWRQENYLGVGAGAHSFFDWIGSCGVRFNYPRNERAFVRAALMQATPQANDVFSNVTIDQRGPDALCLEYIMTSLRTCEGVNLKKLGAIKGRNVNFSAVLAPHLRSQALDLTKTHLRLDESEWFREHAWSLIVYEALQALDMIV